MEDTHNYCPYDGCRYKGPICEICFKPRHVKKPQWKKILYEKQPFGDTYVDENFLNSLTTKENSRKYDFSTLIDSTVEIAFALNSLILFLEIHEIAHMEYLSENILIALCFLCLIFGYMIYIALLPAERRSIKPIRIGFLLSGTLYTVCPVLATINKNYADDTIYLMTFVFCILHLVFYDYSFVQSEVTKDRKSVPDVKSMNFALIAVLLLSSRLASLNSVYCLLWVGFMIFGFLPYLRSAICNYSSSLHGKLGVMLCVFNSWVVCHFSYFLGTMVLFTYFFIRYLGPLWLISVYHYKNEITGPWDLPDIKHQK